MPGLPNVSLHGIRAFEAVARQRSFKIAAEELGVTPSAVSHQIRLLEEAVGSALFARRHNAVDLTAEGCQFFADVSPAIATISRARMALQRNPNEVIVGAPPCFAYCWLIPRLASFRDSYPDVLLTILAGHTQQSPSARRDIIIEHDLSDEPANDMLFPAEARPLCSPLMATAIEGAQSRNDPTHILATLPILSCMDDAQDWRNYCRKVGIDPALLRFSSRFDSEHGAFEACIAGLGVFIPSLRLAHEHIKRGLLVAVPDCSTVTLGCFRAAVRGAPRRAVTNFTRWLHQQAQQPHAE